MPDLATQIRDYVDAIDPPVTIQDVQEILDGRREVGTHATRPPRTPLARIGLGAVAVVTVAVALVLALVMAPSESPPSSAATVLADTALVAASSPGLASSGPDRYLFYEVTQTLIASTPEPVGVRQFPMVTVETVDTWVAPDGSGRQRLDVTGRHLLVPADRGAWVAAGSPSFGPPLGVTDTKYPTATGQPVGGPLVPGPGGTWSLSYPDTKQYPTEPSALERAIEQQFRVTDGPTTVFLIAGNLLQANSSPALRSALFELIKGLPGVQLLGQRRDTSGRRGVGVAIDGFGNRYVLVFDPRTSAVLGENVETLGTSTLGERIPKGTVVQSTVYGPSGLSASTTQFPSGTTLPDG